MQPSFLFCSVGRRIINLFLFILFIGAAGWAGYKFFFENKGPKHNPLLAIPQNAVAFVTGENIIDFYRELDNTSLFWQDLKNSGFIEKFDHQLDLWNVLDKKGALKNINEAPFVISLHPSDDFSLNYLICLSLPGKSKDEIESILKQANLTIKKNGNGVHEIISPSGIKWFYYNFENLVVFSPSNELIDLAVKECTKEFDETKFYTYHQLKRSKGDHVKSALFVRNNEFINMISKHFNNEIENFITQYNTGLAGLYDVVIEPNSLLMRGFNLAPDSIENCLQFLYNQKPVKPEIIKLLPQSTQWFYFMGLSNPEQFIEQLHKDPLFQKSIEEFNGNYNVNLKQHLASWFDGQLVLFAMSEYENERLLIVKSDEAGDPLKELEFLCNKLDSTQAGNLNYNGKLIKRLNEDNLFGLMFGNLFSKVNSPYYMQIENSIVFSSSSDALIAYLNEISSDQFLVRNVEFYDNLENHFSTNTNLLFYLNFNSNYSSLNLLDSNRAALLRDVNFIKNTESVTYSLTAKDKELYYSQVLLKYKGSESTTSNTIWDIGFDTLLQSTPHIIDNHISGTKNIIIQDRANVLHSLSATGKTEFSVKLNEPVIDKIINVDIMNNGKHQLLFVTATKLHLIDLKGNYVSGFPVSLQKIPTSAPAAYDYESDGNYRILLPCGKNIVNYNKEGKPVTGFAFAGLPGNITQAPLFTRIDAKDYLFICDDIGNVKLTDRKGNDRFTINFKLKNRSSQQVHFEKGTTVETSKIVFCSNNGTIYRQFLSGLKDSLPSKTRVKNGYGFIDTDDDGTNELVVVDSSQIKWFDFKGKLIQSINPLCNDFQLQAYKAGHGLSVIGGTCKNEEIIMAYDNFGHDVTRIKLVADSPFTVADINNDNKFEIIYCYRNRIFVYTLR